jgi:hypothetical protein
LPETLILPTAAERSPIFRHSLEGAADNQGFGRKYATGAGRISRNKSCRPHPHGSSMNLQAERDGSHGGNVAVARIDREPMNPANRTEE